MDSETKKGFNYSKWFRVHVCSYSFIVIGWDKLSLARFQDRIDVDIILLSTAQAFGKFDLLLNIVTSNYRFLHG